MIFRYLKYFFRAKYRKGFGVHSPFTFSFLNDVIFTEQHHDDFRRIEMLRKKMLKNKGKIHITDYGSGSRVVGKKYISIHNIAKHSSIRPRLGKVLFECVRFLQPGEIVELGTSLGFSTLYLALANKKTTVYTIEGCPERCAIAKENFKELGAENIVVCNDRFEDAFAKVLKNNQHTDKLIFIDGNHNHDSTVTYFNMVLQMATKQTVVIFDDIHWSDDMEKAWGEIKSNALVTLTIDLFYMGLVFFNENLTRNHLVVRY